MVFGVREAPITAMDFGRRIASLTPNNLDGCAWRVES
jgi:hypothetical protein